MKTIEKTCNVTYQQGQADYFVEDLGEDVTLEMVTVESGTFMMGSPNHELGDKEGPQHSVIIQPFFMSKFAVTQVQWQAVAALSKVQLDLDPTPSRFKEPNRPVEGISWCQAVEFCDGYLRKRERNIDYPVKLSGNMLVVLEPAPHFIWARRLPQS